MSEVRFAPGTQRPLDLGEPTVDDVLGAVGDFVIAYRPYLSKIAGSTTAGVLLCQLLFWHRRSAHEGFWIRGKSVDVIEEETGLTRHEQPTARKNLRVRRILHEKHGYGNALQFRLDLARLMQLIADFKPPQKPVRRRSGKPTSGVQKAGKRRSENRNPEFRKPESGFPEPAAPKEVHARASERGEERRDGQKQGADQKEIVELASELFDRLSYSGNNASVVWQVATLVVMGQVSRAAAIDATNGVRACSPRNPIAYFLHIVIERCPHVGTVSKKGKHVLKPVPLPADWKAWPTSPPQKCEPSQEVLDIAGTFKRPPAQTPMPAERKQQALAALYLAEKNDAANARDPPVSG